MARTYLGIDIRAEGLTLAALQRHRPATALKGLRFESLDEVFEFSSRHPNIRDTRRFVEAVRRGCSTLAGPEERVALSLPDRCGRLLFTEADAPFKSRQEGIEILKWRLKGSLPLPPAQVHLDYQVLDRREEGRQRCLVAVIGLAILEQYEDLLNEAGRHAVTIDFHSLHLYNYYRPRLDMGDEFIFVSLERDLMTMQYFSGRTLSYQRSRAIGDSPEAAFREINRTLVEIYEHHASARRCNVFAHLDPDRDAAIREVLQAVFEREVRYLDPALKRFSGAAQQGGMSPTGSVVAALGAAERLMRF